MPYDIVFSDIDNAIRADVTGERSVDNSIDLWTRVAEQSAKRNQLRILVVLNLIGTLTTTQLYSLASNYGKYNLTPAHRIALVDLNSQSLPDNRFSAVVAANRGLHMDVFGKEEQALDWLMRDLVT